MTFFGGVQKGFSRGVPEGVLEEILEGMLGEILKRNQFSKDYMGEFPKESWDSQWNLCRHSCLKKYLEETLAKLLHTWYNIVTALYC